ncbi:membrane protein [Streptomyces sp. NRRL B-1568]|nr:membrane protein [Streptomyces sp. NRRL B-1568]
MSKGGASIPDEEWERFLREAEAGASGAPKEPSARARMVTERLRGESGQPQGWRTYPPARRRRRTPWYVVGVLVVLGLLVAAVAPERVVGWFGGGGGDSAPLAAESDRPSGPPGPGSGEQPTLAEPFRGSPAAQWANGVEGVNLPAAQATGWMSQEQVAQALARTQDFLTAANLDPGVLRGEQPEKAIALINPHQRDVQDYLAAAFRAPDRDSNPLLLFSRFAPAKARLVGNIVKTRGRITYREGRRGALEVTADVTYVYPVVRATAGSDDVARTIVRRELVMSWDDPAKVVTEPGTFSLVSYKSDTTNGGCDNTTGYFIPTFRSEHAAEQGSGQQVDPYDRSKPMDTRMQEGGQDKCGTATRS